MLDPPSATTPDPIPAEPPGEIPTTAAVPAPDGSAGFAARGRVRRRARFLRKARELAYRDLGGLVFNLHRFGHRNDALVLAKLDTLGRIDAELRALEDVLGERQPVTVLREAGVTACPRCAAIHSGEDRFCPNCGLSMSRHIDLPIAGAAAAAAAPAGTANPASTSPPTAPTKPAAPSGSPAAPPPPTAPPSPPVAAVPTALSGPPAAATPPAGPPPPGGAPPTTPARAPSIAPATDQPTEILNPPAGEA